MDYETNAAVLKALGHPIRLRMIEGLMSNECNVNKIVHALGLPQSTVSQHLGILKQSGIISPRKEGVKTCYRVTNQKIVEIMKLL